MQALFIHAQRDLRLQDVPPDPLGPQQVRIAVQRGGICGSDLHYYQHAGFGPVRLREPMILGHEVSGKITEIGAGTTGFNLGDLVAISPSRPCATCQYCLRGLPNHCENMRFYGSAQPFPHIQGAFRQDIIADAQQCVAAQGLTPAQAASAEPLAVVLHGIKQAGPILGKTVLVTGCGPIGVLTILALRATGAARIIATDISDRALSFAQQAGADQTLNIKTNPDALAPYQSGKGHFDLMIECSGIESALAEGLKSLAPRGVIVQLGIMGNARIPLLALLAKEIELRGSFRFHSEFPMAVHMMQTGKINVDFLITHTLPYTEFQRAFDIASDKSHSMKVQLDFSEP